MKQITMILVAALVALAPVYAQTKKESRSARREASAAARMLKREGFKALELGSMESLLEKYFLKVNSGCSQVIGTADGCMSTNLAKVTALSNAASEYAMLAGGDVRGRIVSSTSSLTGQQIDNVVASFERLVCKDIRGELVSYVTAVRDRRGSVTARIYCIVDVDAAYLVRKRAMELALEEQALAEKYGSQVSDWIDDGFNKARY